MKALFYGLLVIAAAMTIGALGVWTATDRHYYTKFEVVEETEVAPDPNDPFAGTGLYEEDNVQAVRRDEFHLGLFPTPQRITDKHALSVISLSIPPWLLAGIAGWILWRRGKRRKENANPSTEDGSTRPTGVETEDQSKQED